MSNTASSPAPFTHPRRIAVAVCTAAMILSGCATFASHDAAADEDARETGLAAARAVQGARDGGNRNSAAAAAAAAAAAVTQGSLRPFADVAKDAKEIPGYFTLWQKDDKIYLEITPEQFDSPFLFQLNHARGVGEKGVYGGMMGYSQVARFKRIGNSVQLLASNTAFTAKKDTPMARMVAEGFSDSLLASASVLSAPHPTRKSVLVEVNNLLLNDLPAGSRFAQGVYQRGYSFDSRNSSIDKAYGTPDQVSFLVLAHYMNGKAGSGPGGPMGTQPFENLADPRSLFLGLQYSFAELPQPMTPRLADPRIGHFTAEMWDFTDDLHYTARKHYVDRWRLEKKDPSAALSEPVKPIVFWIDRNVPLKYRGIVRDGILEWNKAFEQIGFKDAIVVKQQADDAEFDTADAKHATVRWFVGTDVAFAIGPSDIDPRTGEILDADVAIPENWSRGDRRFLREDLGTTAWPAFQATALAARGKRDARMCTYAAEALDESQFGLDLLEERGDIAADGPEAEAFVMGALKDVVMHEVGHALGLRHNFRASTAYSLDKLADRDFTSKHGLAGSVMDYAPVNLALKGEKQGQYHQSTLGPYDFWAIEYAYKPIDPAHEKAELAEIASRGATDPMLAFSSDEEAGSGIDPAASQFDFGSDSLAYLDRRFRLTAELWTRLEGKRLKTGDSYDVLRRSFDSGMRQTRRAAQVASKYVSGVSYVRDYAGTGRNPLTPVGADRQRAALKLMTDNIFAADNFRFPAEFMQRMGVDYLMQDGGSPDFSLNNRVLALQSGALGQLLHESVAARLLDSETKAASPSQSLRLAELYTALHTAIWSELKTGRDINLFRRNLQREHATRIASTLIRPAASMPADARALMRQEARDLRGEVLTAQNKPALSKEARAHLAEVYATLDEALRAPLVRPGV